MTYLPPISQLETLSIINRAGELVPFRLNKVQHDLYSNLGRYNLVLKARQQGVSTLLQAIIYKQVSTRPFFKALTVPHHFTSIGAFRRRFDTFNQNDPAKPYMYEFAQRLFYRFPQLNSAYYIAHVLPDTTFSIAHLSEWADWDARQYNDLPLKHIEEITPFLGDGLLVIETSPNPHNPYFQQFCLDAASGVNEYKLHFYEWWHTPEYSLPLAAGQQVTLEPEEKELCAAHDLTLEQILWRRRMVAEMGLPRFRVVFPESLKQCMEAK